MRNNGRFVKGVSGNPAGRPPGESLAEQIRTAGTPEIRRRMLEKMLALAADPHEDSHVRIEAAEWIAKHGWPDETRGQTTVTSDGGVTTVTHVHQP
jgi:hypothetical protein